MKIESCSLRILAAYATASCGFTLPFVHTSRVELVVVRLLPDARVGHRVVDLADRREERVDGDRPDRHRRGLVALGRHVPRPTFTVSSIESGPFLSSVAMTWSGFSTWRPSTSWMSRAWTTPGPSLSMRTVYVFAVAALSTTSLRFRTISVTSSTTSLDGRELVERAFDADGRDGRALERREQNAAQRVADRDPVAALERLARELAVELGQRLGFDVNAARTDQIAPVARDDVRRASCFSLCLQVHAMVPARLRTRSPAAPVTCPCAAA